ncbi:Tryptophan--tRNA ligase [Buchnera aphidicola (Eriosoma grossulariae)]|uniref:tryptophan--tRNA ligase n=1 Tax=Buchnera aphidicola TaxID=9 RepID=UPI003463B63C
MKLFKKKLFSAIQPSGMPTIGNYISVLNNLVHIQDKFDCLFCIADLHSITVRRKSNDLSRSILDMIALYLACGFDPNQAIIFIQSHVYEHTQLSWILNCFSYVGELSRMTQFKDKSIRFSNNINVGLLNYPVLMASDVLLYKTDIILVGEDQKQHLELIHDIVIRFNNIYKKLFVLPSSLISKTGSKIMSLLNPTKKMSKSDPNTKNTIFLLEDISSIIKKIHHAQTDSDNPCSIIYNKKNKAGISNLLNIFSSFSGKTIKSLENEYANVMYSKFKHDLSDFIADKISCLQKKYFDFRKNEDYLQNIVKSGAEKAQCQAKITLDQVYKAIGLPVKYY